jgi:zinc protease
MTPALKQPSGLVKRFSATIGLAAFATAMSLAALLLNPNPARAMKIQEVTSPGGIKAWLVEEHSVPLMALRFAFDGGNSQDPANKDGVANFLTAMMDEGAGDLPSLKFQEQMEEIAMRMSFEDSRDALYGSFETLTVNRPAAVELLRLAVTKPRFDSDAVERIRGQLLAGLAFEEKDPDRVAAKEWFSAAFAGHPYGRSSNGTKGSLPNITADDLRTYHSRVFAKDTLKVAAVGDIDPQTLGKLLDTVFGDLPVQAKLAPVSNVPPRKGGGLQIVEMNVPQSVASFGLPGVARNDPDFMAAFVMNHILGGGGFSSRLMEQVREKRGLAYSVYSYLQPYQHTSIFAGGVATKNEEIGQSLEVIRAEFNHMADEGPTPVELENAKKYLVGSYALRFDTNSKIASQLLGIMQDNLGIDYIEKRNALVEAVTLEDVKRVAKRILDTDNMMVTVVGRPKGLKATKS